MNNSTTPRTRSAWSSFASRFSRRDLIEAALVAIAFLAYFGVRGAVIDRPEDAYWNAIDVIDIQRGLGIFWEADLNRWADDNLFFAQTMNIIYFWLHFPLIIVFGIWLYFFRRNKYTLARDAFLVSGAISLIVYWTFPVAPPRELPALAAEFDPNAPAYVTGFIDTMREYLGYGYQAQSTQAFVNPYAAMPSLLFGWDLLLGLAMIWAFWRERWWWLVAPVAVALPAAQVFAITLTANHFFLDAAAGGVVALIGLALALGLKRWVYPVLDHQARRIPNRAVRRWFVEDEPVHAG
ncbi:MAG: phosphatase PAP2 family protein [Dehalococcoidia bacterium]